MKSIERISLYLLWTILMCVSVKDTVQFLPWLKITSTSNWVQLSYGTVQEFPAQIILYFFE